MKRIFKIPMLFALIACSNLNQVRTDGSRNINGKVTEIVYWETNKDINSINKRLIHLFGQPSSNISGEMIWDLNSKNVFDNAPIRMVIHYDSVYDYREQEKVLDYVSFDVCLIDASGTDLLSNIDIKSKAVKVFQKTIDEVQ